MPQTKKDNSAPEGYARLEGSERRLSKRARLLGPVDENEKFSVTIVLRRRTDGPALPDFDYFVQNPPHKRKRLAADEFAGKYGAHPDDIKNVVAFAQRFGLQVTGTHAGRRTVVVSGTAGQFSRAFGVTFGRYEQPQSPARHGRKGPVAPVTTYRGRDGFIYVPKELADAIVGVFGLDNRPVSLRTNNPGDPPSIGTLTVQQVSQLYNFPSPGMAISGQTIGIIAPTGGGGGYLQSDIDSSFSAMGLTPPQVIPISVDGVNNGTLAAAVTVAAAVGQSVLTFASTSGMFVNSVGSYNSGGTTYYLLLTAVTPTTITVQAYDNNTGQFVNTGFFTAIPVGTLLYFNLDGETNQDICISGAAAPGANVAVYFTTDTQAGWVDLINRVLHPEAGDFPAGVNPASVLSASWAIAPGDDPDGLSWADTNWGTGVTTNTLQAMTAAFQDAAILQTGPTICIASADFGSNPWGIGRAANTSATTVELYTTVAASAGQSVLTFTSTTGVTAGSLGAYTDPVTGVWYYLLVTAVTATTVTVEALNNATQTWVATGFFDNIPAATLIYFNLTFSGDGYAHVCYPGSDPWVLSCGGTTLGQYLPMNSTTPAWVEYAWNDAFQNPTYPWGGGGGGISGYFPVPSYQSNAGIPNSINPGLPTNSDLVTVTPSAPFNATGRGVPDVASNSSYNSGYSLVPGTQTGYYLGGIPSDVGNGTSAAAPLWAGLVAVLNSNAGFNIGFLNPTLYALGPGAFNPINPLWRDPTYPQLAGCPADNSNFGIAGYPTGPGWDACTGLGSPNAAAILTALEELQPVYILGGYQSPDIIITDLTTNQPVPIGGAPGGRWDTLLAPSTNYGFSANVHNDSSVTVNNVVVQFWAIPGGVGTNGTMIGTPQTVSIAAHSTKTVNASANFVSAPAGEHLCAVVSLYSPSTGCDVDATNALLIPNPGYSDTHQCSAWRNTDSMFAFPGMPFKFPLGFGEIPFHLEEPIVVHILPIHVPVAWNQTVGARNIADILQSAGAKSNLPLYLLPSFNRAFRTMHLKTQVAIARGGKIEERSAGQWILRPEGGKAKTSLEIAGEIPADAKNGDIVLVNISVSYPKMDRYPARTVEFLEVLHITDKARRG